MIMVPFAAGVEAICWEKRLYAGKTAYAGDSAKKNDYLRHLLAASDMNASDLARPLGVHASMGSKSLKGERSLARPVQAHQGGHPVLGPIEGQLVGRRLSLPAPDLATLVAGRPLPGCRDLLVRVESV